MNTNVAYMKYILNFDSINYMESKKNMDDWIEVKLPTSTHNNGNILFIIDLV